MSDSINEKLLIPGADSLSRCWWCGTDADYLRYHDEEWGHPISDDRVLFEKICLEGFQSGLSWLTILRKRENFRRVFSNFNFKKVAKFTSLDVDRIVQDATIVRHRGKIESTINNAARALELVVEFGSLAAYFWQFEPEKPVRMRTRADIVSVTAESTRMSKDLKKRGWSFVGPTTCYAFMQAMGMVNDHLVGCCIRADIEQRRRDFVRPNAINA